VCRTIPPVSGCWSVTSSRDRLTTKRTQVEDHRCRCTSCARLAGLNSIWATVLAPWRHSPILPIAESSAPSGQNEHE
jgi:hypothetical protein